MRTNSEFKERKVMEYDEFKERMANEFLNIYPTNGKNYKVEIKRIRKTNVEYDGLTVIDKDAKGTSVLPTVYINGIYEKYLHNEDLSFEKALQDIVKLYIYAMNEVEAGMFDLSFLNNEKLLKERIVLSVINTEQNKELLKTLPHRNYLDLSIICHIAISENGRSTINYDMLNNLPFGLTEDELFELAYKNTKRLHATTICSIMDAINDVRTELGFENVSDDLDDMDDAAIGMYVISNKSHINGAVSILDEEAFHSIAEKWESNLFIIPSSIHELIATRAYGNGNEVASMVATINQESILPEERLSNQVYFYDRNLRKIFLATDTPNKKLC